MHYSAKRGLEITCRLSVTLVDHDHKPWKLIARTISPTSSLLVAERSSTYFHRIEEHGEILKRLEVG